MKAWYSLLLVLLGAPAVWGQWGLEVDNGVFLTGFFSNPAIDESSGLISSRQYPGVLWTHNDGGDRLLFAVNWQGKYMRAFTVPVTLVDCEDIAIDTQGYLYLADTGTNGLPRTHSAVHKIREPSPYHRSKGIPIVRTWLLRFPRERRQDCEAFFVYAGYGYLINKTPVNGTVSMYRFSLADKRTSIPLQFVTRIPVENHSVTGADISRDGLRLGLTTTDGIALLFIRGNPATAGIAEQVFVPFESRLMEGGCFFGPGFITSAEKFSALYLFTQNVFPCESAPVFNAPLTDVTVLAGGDATFGTTARGCPDPQYRWEFNGSPIPGATSSSLRLINVTTNQAGVYTLIAYNPSGEARTSAVLTVRTKPNLRITEVMSSPNTNSAVRTEDWWELTNFELQAFNLRGWRFNDRAGGLTDPYTIPNDVIIGGGETIVFVEGLTPEQFRTWWGSANVPDSVQIISYSGPRLSFGANGDSLSLWDNVSSNPNDFVDSVTFGPADPGVTFTYDPATDRFGAKSQEGVNGAFRAANGGDVGSPGIIQGP